MTTTTYEISQVGGEFHVNSRCEWVGAFGTLVDAESWIARRHAEEQATARAKRDKANAAARAKRQAMKGTSRSATHP